MIPDIFNDPVFLRTGWAILHLFWQGTLIALALKGALMLLEHRSPRLRYTLALASLFLMAALPVLLLCKPPGRDSNLAETGERAQIETSLPIGTTSLSIPNPGKPESHIRSFDFVTPIIPWMAAGWLLGTALLLLKTVGGIIQVHSLMRKATAHCKTDAASRFRQLAARAGVADVPILESGHVSGPTVAGWFRPVVLLPRGVLDKINLPMLDALVAHEFAHIRRHDRAMNLLQTVIEDLLFFHPAMWWVTRSIRAEREACCDDDAVAICGDMLVYARALSQAEQFRSSIPVIALGSSPLLHRIRRLTEMRVSKMNHSTAFCSVLLAVASIVATAAGSAILAKIPPQNEKPSVTTSASGVDQDSDKAKPEVRGTQAHKGGKYALLCGIIGGTVDKTTGKPAFFPPLQKDGKPVQATCILIDVSTPISSKVSGELQASKLIHKVDPVYPEPAIKEHVGIRVVLHININEEGLVTGAEAVQAQTVPPDRDSSGNWVGGVRSGVVNSVIGAAKNAVKQWKYSPTLLDGKAIPITITISIDFTFDKDGSPKIHTFAS